MTKETREMIRSDAFDIAQYIGTGHNNAVSRETLSKCLGVSDRIVRQLIEKSSQPVINVGYGYFVPDPADAVDMAELRAYVQQERRRISTIQEKLEMKYLDMVQEEHPQEELFEQMELSFDEEEREP